MARSRRIEAIRSRVDARFRQMLQIRILGERRYWNGARDDQFAISSMGSKRESVHENIIQPDPGEWQFKTSGMFEVLSSLGRS
jgi:hypothetical protein